MAEPTVFVVDDDLGALRSMTWLMEEAGIPVRAFSSGEQFLDQYDPGQTGCLVLDMRMPSLGGLEVQDRLIEQGIDLPVLFLTAHGSVAACVRAFKKGAVEFLEKPIENEELLQHVRKALAQDAERRNPAADFHSRLAKLTPREKYVCDMLISGKTLKEIAKATNVTVVTVWRHRGGVFRKMGVANDVDLTRIATQCGYLPSGAPPRQARP